MRSAEKEINEKKTLSSESFPKPLCFFLIFALYNFSQLAFLGTAITHRSRRPGVLDYLSTMTEQLGWKAPNAPGEPLC